MSDKAATQKAVSEALPAKGRLNAKLDAMSTLPAILPDDHPQNRPRTRAQANAEKFQGSFPKPGSKK